MTGFRVFSSGNETLHIPEFHIAPWFGLPKDGLAIIVILIPQHNSYS